MHKFIHRFRPLVRAFITFMTTAFLFASLATTANAYPDLSNCSQRIKHIANPAGLTGIQTSTDNHSSVAGNTSNTGDKCCGTCDRCNGYFGAHLQGLNLTTTCATPPTLQLNFSRTQVHATDFSSRPNLPPPKPDHAHTHIGV